MTMPGTDPAGTGAAIPGNSALAGAAASAGMAGGVVVLVPEAAAAPMLAAHMLVARDSHLVAARM